MKKIFWILLLLAGIETNAQVTKQVFDATQFGSSAFLGGINYWIKSGAWFTNTVILDLIATNSFKIVSSTASRALITDASKFVTNSAVTATELSYVSGVTSGIQAQLDSKGTGGGNVVNTGASIANAQVPTYTDTTGTNMSPITVTNGLTIQGGKLYATNVDAGNQLTGTLSANQFPALTGDVTTSAGALAATLATVATPGTATKVTFNAKGLVTSGATADLSGSDVTGTLAAGRFPALSGDVTTSAGSLATTIANGAVTFAKRANMSTGKLVGRSTAGAGSEEEISIGTGVTLSGGTLSATGLGGTVTSVDATVPSILTLGGNPITTSGTLAFDLATQTKNTFFMGPTSGSAAQPTFRVATLASADFVNQGTTTTILHGNGSGNPSWSAVDLTGAEVTGALKAASFPTLTGDITTAGGALATTLATVATPGTSTKVTYNAKGLVTSGAVATLDSSDFANQGTTTTLLHGNASGNPSFGAVALATDVSGTLQATQFPALTGDITTSAGSLATALKSTGTAGTYVKTTFDAQGRETSGSTSIDLSTADATGTLAAGRFPALTGDVTTSAGALATTIAAQAVTYSKIQNMATGKLIGRSTAGAGSFEELTVGSGLSLAGGSLSATGGSAPVGTVVNSGTPIITAIPTYADATGTNISPSKVTVSASTNLNTGSLVVSNLTGVMYSSAGSGVTVTTNTGSGSVVFSNTPSIQTPTMLGQVLMSATNNILWNLSAVTLDSSGTNIIVDFARSDVTLTTTTNMALLQTTNRPSATNTPDYVLRIFANGGTVIVNCNATPLGWMLNNGLTFPITINAGYWGIFSFKAYGGSETNVGLVYATFSTNQITVVGPTLDEIAGDAASSSIQNGSHTNEFNYTDPGAGNFSFMLKGTNSTDSTTFGLQGQMTSGMAKFFEVKETTASTGGSGSQYLANFETLASSTASPLRVAPRGTEAFRVDSVNPRILANNGSATYPTYGFADNLHLGMYADANSLYVGNTGDGTFFSSDANDLYGTVGGNSAFAGTVAYGFLQYAATGGIIVSSSGTSSYPVATRMRVIADTTNTTLDNDPVAPTTGTGTFHSNDGASGNISETLPAASTKGLNHTFYVSAAHELKILCNGSDQIRVGASISTATTGDVKSSTVGNSITIVSLKSGLWVAISTVGTWTVD